MPSRGRSTPSSASTPTDAPEGPGLWVVLACEDDPRVCTGQRTVRLGLAREAGPRPPPAGAFLLDPHVDLPLSPQDHKSGGHDDVIVVDCSWNRLSERGAYPRSAPWLKGWPHRRRLPWLLAANPQHHGRLGELNTAEALGASIYLLAGPEAAEAFLGRFSFGPPFLALNKEPLKDYRNAGTPEAICLQEKEYFA